MRAVLLAGAVLGASALLQAQQPAGQPQPPPIFRGGVELLALDVTVVDSDGRQVTDLAAADFSVEVDGDLRTVSTAEYVVLIDPAAPLPVERRAPMPASTDEEAFYSTNVKSRGGGRVILLLVDQGNVRTGAARHVMRSAAAFVDKLAPGDRVGLVAIPGPGAVVEFTTDHEKVREGLLTIVGQKQPHDGRFNISLTEALAAVERSDGALHAELIARECGTLLTAIELVRCQLEVDQEAGQIVMQQRTDTQRSLRGMRGVLEALAPIEGPKSVILISEGLVLESSTQEVDEIAAMAADVRASLDVLLLDVPPMDVTQARRPTTPREDRDKQLAGLESLAGLARGTLHRIPVSADAAFDRINRSLAGYYLLGIEARPNDRDGRRHRIAVRTNRRGVTINSRRGFLATTSPAAKTPAEAVARALKAPLPLADMPVRLATWTYKVPGTPRVRIVIAAEVGRLVEQSLEYTAGLLAIDQAGKAVAQGIEPRTLTPTPFDEATASFLGAIDVDPGTYRVRLALADSENRMASVERKVVAWQMDAAEMTIGDLIVAAAPAPGSPITPRVEARVDARVAALMEVYAPSGADLDGLRATVDILSDEAGPALLSAPMEIGGGPSAEIRSLRAEIGTSALPPGRYLARATITERGAPKGHFIRPFYVVAATAAADNGSGGAGVPVPTARLPDDIRKALVESVPAFDRQELLAPDIVGAALTVAADGRPAAVKAALADARRGVLGPAALEALAAGDQTVAAFLKGLDLLVQAQPARAMQQLQTSMQMTPSFAPARLYLAACLAEGQRHREAASLLQSVAPAIVPAGGASRLAGEAWLRAGNPALAVQALERAAAEGPGDARTTRNLGLAYLLADRVDEGVDLLGRHLETSPTDQAALVAAIYGVYSIHRDAIQPDRIAEDRARVATWARAYASSGGPNQGLVDRWKAYLDQSK